MSGTVGELTEEQLVQLLWDAARECLQGHLQRGVMEGFYVTTMVSSEHGRSIVAEMYGPPSQTSMSASSGRTAGRAMFPIGAFKPEYPLDELRAFTAHAIATTCSRWALEQERHKGTPVARDWGEA